MNCPDEQILDDFLDGELPDGQRLEVETHVSTCPVCQERIEAVKRIDAAARDALSTLKRSAPPPQLTQIRRRARSLAMPLAVAAAAAVIVAAVTAGLWIADHGTTTPVVAEPPVAVPPIKSESAEPAPVQIAAPTEAPAPAEEEPVFMPPFDAQSLASLSPAEYLKMRANMRQWARPAADTLPDWKVEQYRRVLLYSRGIVPVDNG